MPHMSGSALVIEWITSGTVTVSGDQRRVTWKEQQNIADSTAGADAADSHVKTFRSVDGSFDSLFNGSPGSALYVALIAGAQGTLRWYQQGTAVVEVHSILATITQVNREAPFDDVQMVDWTWKGNGDWIQHPYRA